ncbi:hypothetical protein HDC94_000036 [Leifsonia sp. AK011]|uniref:hypothetical protein n=1 Tax=Leifsonia sp. AK011 TaxID=2723075 RepID=UPI0015C9CF6A|nr:hypothetical protein [Leifsonia sp. AK011]NYF08880.1 hypothetical protein [Leifsonia sp. AK011]
MRTAEPVALPERTPARRSRGPVAILGLIVAVLGSLALSMASVSVASAADLPAPAEPQPVLILNDDCTATLSLVDLVVGRSYDISIVEASGAKVLDLTLAATDTVLDSFATVPAGSHVLTVTDSDAPDFTATRAIDIAPCEAPAGTSTQQSAEPTVVATAHECDLLGATDVRVDATGLGSGAYPVGVAVDGAPVPGVVDIELTAESSSAVIPDVPNGDSYVVWMKDSTGGVVSADQVTLPICDLPTLSEPAGSAAGPSTGETTAGLPGSLLAATGSMPVPNVVLTGVGALQVGALIAGTALLRGRGRGGHRA